VNIGSFEVVAGALASALASGADAGELSGAASTGPAPAGVQAASASKAGPSARGEDGAASSEPLMPLMRSMDVPGAPLFSGMAHRPPR
jgi:hypothetical protein